MIFRHLLVPLVVLVAACSETPVEEQGEEAVAEREMQIEEDALSLEEAADEAVKALEADIDSQLAAEGIRAPSAEPAAEGMEN